MKRGYYEKKIEVLESELEKLEEERQRIENQNEGAKKVLISPFVLQSLIKDKERRNKKLLCLKAI